MLFDRLRLRENIFQVNILRRYKSNVSERERKREKEREERERQKREDKS